MKIKILILIILCLSNVALTKEIALTFDDSSGISTYFYKNKYERARVLLRNIEAGTSSKVAFFVNVKTFDVSKNINDETNRDFSKGILELYSNGGHFLGNHSYSHEDLNKTTADDFKNSILLNEDKIKAYPTFRKWFRFPFLHEGDFQDKRDVLRKFLNTNGLTNAYVTIDTSDWYFNSLLQKAKKSNTQIDLEKLRDIYVNSILQAIEHFDSISTNFLKMNMKHTLLLHENDINALFIKDLILAIKAKGYDIISPETAFASEFASIEPVTLRSNDGKLSALAIDKGYKGDTTPTYQNSNYIDEQFEKAIPNDVEIENYKVNLKINFANEFLIGKEKIKFKTKSNKVSFYIGKNIEITDVQYHNRNLKYKVKTNIIEIEIPSTASEVDIIYKAKKSASLIFDKKHMYTAWDNSNFMILKTENFYQSKLDLIVESQAQSTKSPTLHKFVQIGATKPNEKAISPYLYGFAFGEFKTLTKVQNNISISAHSMNLNETEMDIAVDKAFDALKFFENKFKVKFPRQNYDMIFVPQDEAQEKFGFAIMSETGVRDMIKNPKDDWMIVHEILHEWFGSLVTCKSWKHIWLNEGFTVFYTNLYKKFKWGNEEYKREMDLAQDRYIKAIAQKNNYPIVSSAWDEGKLVRGITYSKAALAIEKLSQKFPEEKFHQIVSEYLITNSNKLVTTSDFRIVLDKYKSFDYKINEMIDLLFYSDKKLDEIK